MVTLRAEEEALLEAYLADYRDARERFSLWTYDRRPSVLAARKTWNDFAVWPDRLRWSQVLPALAVWTELDQAARRAGGKLTGFFPHQKEFFMVCGGELKRATMPQYHRARAAAIFAATAHPAVPLEPSQIAIPRKWSYQAFLDDADVKEISGRLQYALLGHREALLWPFMRLAVDAGKKPERRRRDSREDGTALAVELCRRAGLLPSRDHGKRNLLPRDCLARLDNEAREIVGLLREWEPAANRLDVLRAVFEADGLRRSEPDLVWEARLFRFPFLTPAEIRRPLKAKTVEQAAQLLVQGRMSADLAPKTYRHLTARGPRSP